MIKKFAFIIFYNLIFVGVIFSQDNEELEVSNNEKEFHSVYFSITGGGFHASKKTGVYYNGLGENSITRVIGIQQIRDQIFNKLGYDFQMGEYPAEVRYKFGINLGIEAGFWVSEYTAVTLGADYVKLNISEAFTLEADNPANLNGDPLIYPQQILANEQRFQFNLGLHHDVGDNYKAMTFFEWGLNFNAMKVLKHEILIEESLRYSLLYQFNQFEVRNRTGMGFGAFAAFGVRMGFENNMALDFGLKGYFQRVKFVDNQYNMFSELLFIRFVYL